MDIEILRGNWRNLSQINRAVEQDALVMAREYDDELVEELGLETQQVGKNRRKTRKSLQMRQ